MTPAGSEALTAPPYGHAATVGHQTFPLPAVTAIPRPDTPPTPSGAEALRRGPQAEPIRPARGGESVLPGPSAAGPYDAAALMLGTVIPIVGAHPHVGASGVALAVADAAAVLGLRVLLVDCADPARTGLAGVCGVEGASVTVCGAARGIRVSHRALERGAVQVRRMVPTTAVLDAPQVPTPPLWAAAAPTGVDVTVVDLGWDPWPLLTGLTQLGPGWWLAGDQQQVCPVLVLQPTVASVIKAEGVLARYGNGVRGGLLAGVRAVAAVGGQQWDPRVLSVTGQATRTAAERAVFFPWSPPHQLSGWSTDPLPEPTLRAATALLRGVGGRVAAAAGPSPPPSPRRRGLRGRNPAP